MINCKQLTAHYKYIARNVPMLKSPVFELFLWYKSQNSVKNVTQCVIYIEKMSHSVKNDGA